MLPLGVMTDERFINIFQSVTPCHVAVRSDDGRTNDPRGPAANEGGVRRGLHSGQRPANARTDHEVAQDDPADAHNRPLPRHLRLAHG